MKHTPTLNQNRITLTKELCYATGRQAADVQMRKSGRKVWNEDDYNIAAETTNRFMVYGGFLLPMQYEQLTGQKWEAR